MQQPQQQGGVAAAVPGHPIPSVIRYSGHGHWSTTLRSNSLVVLSMLDKAFKDHLEELQVRYGC